VVAKPNVSEALTTSGFANILLECVAFARGVSGGRGPFAEHVAKINEMRLRTGVLGLREDLPAMDEFRDR
jgi:hypothetical protein